MAKFTELKQCKSCGMLGIGPVKPRAYDRRIHKTPFYGRGFYGVCGRCEYNLQNYSKLNECYLCKRLGTSRRVVYRYELRDWPITIKRHWGAMDEEQKERLKSEERERWAILCLGCRNKVLPIIKRQEDVQRNFTLIDRLKLEITKCQKSKPAATCASS